MRISAGSSAEAEQIIVGVWMALELTGIPSPTLTITPQSKGLLIELLFEQTTHEELVATKLPLLSVGDFPIIPTATTHSRRLSTVLTE